MRSETYLKEIRKSIGLRHAVLKELSLSQRDLLVTFRLVTDRSYTAEDVAYAATVSEGFVPTGCRAAVEIKKSVPSEDGMKELIARLFREKYPAEAAFLSDGDVQVRLTEEGGTFEIFLTEEEQRQLPDDALLRLSSQLMRSVCGTWQGRLQTKTREEAALSPVEIPPAEEIYPPRTFRICDYVPLDGAEPKTAVYCADLAGEMKSVTVCGAIVFVEEKLTKNEKPYFRITVSDGSGQAGGVYFPRKAYLEKARGLKQGDLVCLTGDMELYRESYSFHVSRVDFGSPPKGFTPEGRPSRPVPAAYRVVFPEPLCDPSQADVFGEKPLPKSVETEKFVVFDLETTGLNNTSAAAMDKIIEIGAAKIEGGVICEKFSTLLSCPVKLSKEIIDITGLTDDMLVGAPDVKDAIADFFKFCDGCILVGHNVQFDLKFVRFYGEKEGYLFDHKSYDTLTFSQELLSLKNYKLNTVADKFGFTFRHHRAFDDAFVTAKIFLELARMKGGLPEF